MCCQDVYNHTMHLIIAVLECRPVKLIIKMKCNCGKDSKPRVHKIFSQRDNHPVLEIGDTVRISHVKKVFNKGYLPGWTDQVYTVHRVIITPKIDDAYSGPVQYIIRDTNGENIRGAFFGFDLQKVAPPERFRVQEV